MKNKGDNNTSVCPYDHFILLAPPCFSTNFHVLYCYSLILLSMALAQPQLMLIRFLEASHSS